MENKKYSLLIIALYCYSGHVKAVIDHLKAKNPLVDLTLLTDKPKELKKLLENKSVKIEEYNVPTPSNIKWQWLRFMVIKHRQRKFFAIFSKNKRFDIVNIHFPKRYLSYVCKYLRAMSSNMVITPWGSDVLRQNKESLNQLRRLYEEADYIATSPITPLGRKIIEEFGVCPKKIVGNFFGSDIVDFAQKYGEGITQDDAKQRFGLTGRYVVTCGYNRKVPQRHLLIINAISQVKNLLPDNLTLLFPMTYANPRTDYDYVQQIKQVCQEKQLPAVFVTEYLSVEDVYKLRKCTDMFVHIQTTDASSASVKEYILCDKKIVHGSWIKYEELEAHKPLFYFPVDKLDDLSEVIVKAYKSDKIQIPNGVLDFINNKGWGNMITKMNDFFMSIV